MVFADRIENILARSAGWITTQRWYGDKSRVATSLRPENIMPVEVGKVHSALAMLRISYERGDDSRYFVPVIISDEAKPGEPEDALRNDAFLRWFAAGFAENRTIDGGWSWQHASPDVPDADRVASGTVRVISSEQSNTSVVVDDRWIVKVFRKLQPGINPDLEIGAFLTRGERFTHVPALYGLAEVQGRGESITIAALQEFVPNAGDGWSWLLGRLASLDETSIDDLVAAIGLLGQRTAELHLALASDTQDPAFAPEEMTQNDAEVTIRRIIAEMEQSVEGLARRLTPDDVERIHKGIGQLMGGAWSLVGSRKTRVHGDYHLGQTLRTLDDDFCIIDFEGEPSRPMEQRREKQTPLKDVAGMLRSLDYAAATAMELTREAGRQDAIRAWLERAGTAYQDAYRRTIMMSPVDLVPRDPDAFRAGLDVMIAEKALYEVRYELDNRPDWLAIPLNGIRRLVGIPVPE
ncbi:MAG TPA: phosphotransferase [Thermomicrobiales bacterium]|nr:phosphotransferase [Thermomicrobiales bacterium]